MAEPSFLDIFKEKGKSVLLPGLAATLGTGALASYMTSREGPRMGESPEERRSRILRNGLLAGGMTGGTILGGTALSALNDHSFKGDGKSMLPGILSGPASIASDSPLVTGTGAGAGYLLGRNRDKKWFGTAIGDKLDDIAETLLPQGASELELKRKVKELRGASPAKLQELITQHRNLQTGGLEGGFKVRDSIANKFRNMLGSRKVPGAEAVFNRIKGPDFTSTEFDKARLKGPRKHAIPALLASLLGVGAGAASSVGKDVSNEI